MSRPSLDIAISPTIHPNKEWQGRASENNQPDMRGRSLN